MAVQKPSIDPRPIWSALVVLWSAELLAHCNLNSAETVPHSLNTAMTFFVMHCKKCTACAPAMIIMPYFACFYLNIRKLINWHCKLHCSAAVSTTHCSQTCCLIRHCRFLFVTVLGCTAPTLTGNTVHLQSSLVWVKP